MKSIKVKKVYIGGEILEHCLIQVKAGLIADIQHIDKNSDFEIDSLAPALVDVHINGGERYHFTKNASEQALEDIETAAAKNGVGYLLPTLITSSLDNIEKGIKATQNYLERNTSSGILGMHLEGPFLSVKKRGAHLEKYIQKGTKENLQKIFSQAQGCIKIITVATEELQEGALAYLLEQDTQVALGHSSASYEQAQAAFKTGVSLVTHLYNAMSSLSHREPGIVGAVLKNKKVFAPIILDGVHLHAAAAKIAFEAIGPKLFLISDALFQNYTKTSFQWEEFDASLGKGAYWNSDGNLAGASISMLDAVKNAVQFLEIPLAKALEMATEIPASVIKTERKFGKIEKGFEAKFISFKGDLDDVKLLDFR
jgi:N-acetylglucosamine-6-phosphate deacetylase